MPCTRMALWWDETMTIHRLLTDPPQVDAIPSHIQLERNSSSVSKGDGLTFVRIRYSMYLNDLLNIKLWLFSC